MGRFEDIMEQMMENAASSEKNVTVGAHYGVNEKTYDSWVREAFILIIEHYTKTGVLDALFPELTGEQRAKVFAYHQAASLYDKKEPHRVPSKDKKYAEDGSDVPDVKVEVASFSIGGKEREEDDDDE